MDGQRAALGTVNVTVRAVKGRPSGSTASIRTLCSPRGRPTRIWRSALPSPGCWAADGARDACHPPHPAYVRSDLSPTRSSSTKSFGCSHAAKCPPLSSLL